MILIVFILGAALIGRWDEPLPFKPDSGRRILAGAAAQAACVMAVAWNRPGCEGLLWAVMGGSLLLACVTDILLCQVYNFTWWIFLAAALALLWCRRSMLAESGSACADLLGGLILFSGLQLLLGGRIYGTADSYAFCACALAGAAQGLSLAGFLTHMLLAYLFLFAVQAARRNINRKGNLRRPVPFLPYITAAFWATLVLCRGG